jgi:hypothetical protein
MPLRVDSQIARLCFGPRAALMQRTENAVTLVEGEQDVRRTPPGLAVRAGTTLFAARTGSHKARPVDVKANVVESAFCLVLPALATGQRAHQVHTPLPTTDQQVSLCCILRPPGGSRATGRALPGPGSSP